MTNLSELLSNLHDAATPRPWEHVEETRSTYYHTSQVFSGREYVCDDIKAHNAELIVALRNHTPEIIAALEAVEGYEKRIPVINSALDAIERVRELHVPAWVDSPPPGGLICAACLHPVEDGPCPTIRALDGE